LNICTEMNVTNDLIGII
jgi:hypothetical protein